MRAREGALARPLSPACPRTHARSHAHRTTSGRGRTCTHIKLSHALPVRGCALTPSRTYALPPSLCTHMYSPSLSPFTRMRSLPLYVRTYALPLSLHANTLSLPLHVCIYILSLSPSPRAQDNELPRAHGGVLGEGGMQQKGVQLSKVGGGGEGGGGGGMGGGGGGGRSWRNALRDIGGYTGMAWGVMYGIPVSEKLLEVGTGCLCVYMYRA
jgi:uncharacterized membrane protein YgcG